MTEYYKLIVVWIICNLNGLTILSIFYIFFLKKCLTLYDINLFYLYYKHEQN